MPLTLYWYILRDLLKLLGLATGVLMMVLSLGFAFAPMTQGILGPWQLIKLVLYLMPATLPYALPFAAAFAATLVFFRIAADNEITACSASGISYRSLCLPVATMGLVLTLSMFVLGNWVVPWFWQQVAELVERDVPEWVLSQLQRRETIEHKGGGNSKLILRADDAKELELKPSPDGPYRRIGLIGVAVGKIDARTHKLEQDFTSEKAVVDFYRRGTGLSMVVRAINPIGKDPRGLLVSMGNLEVELHNVELPFAQEPRFMSLKQLRQMTEHPEMNSDVRIYRDKLLQRIAQLRTVAYIMAHLDEGDLAFNGPDGSTYRLKAPQHAAGDDDVRLAAQDDKPIQMLIGHGLNVRQIIEAQIGHIQLDIDQHTYEPRALISFEKVKVVDQQLPTPAGHLAVRDMEPLTLSEPLMADMDKTDCVNLYQQVVAAAPATPGLPAELEHGGRAWTLREVIGMLRRSIRARVNERASMAVNCLLVMLLAAVMAMLLRNQVPLAIFFWCFLPAIASMLLISSGTNFVKDNPWGLPTSLAAVSVWVGNVFLLVLVGGIYRRLNRN